MTLPFRGNARFPGPLGTAPPTSGGRVPGPLGFRRVDLTQKGTTRAIKTLPMPPPWSSSTIMRVRRVDWKLSDGAPATRDVRQGALPNCPIAAILAALAHTTIGRKRIDDMVAEFIGMPVKTTISDAILETLAKASEGDPDYTDQVKEIVSKRYFSVKLGKDIEVHDTFYARYTDGDDLDLVFMTSPTAVLWPCVIEKACALLYGSYTEIGNYRKHNANEFWELLVGSKPQGIKVSDATDVERIREVARGAAKVPTMGASREQGVTKVTPWHAFAVTGIKGSTIELYDPAKAKMLSLSLEDFRSNFQVMLFGNP